jgi:hypothetical protein
MCGLVRNEIFEEYTVIDAKDGSGTFLPFLEQPFSDLRNIYVPEGPTQVGFCSSGNWYMYGPVEMQIQHSIT